jgi:hypothetical protein
MAVGVCLCLSLPAAQPLPERTTEAVIFADDRYDVVGWAGDPVGTREFFVDRGFRPLPAEELAAWMGERTAQGAYGSVALLPTGIVPGALLDPGGWEAVCKGWSDKKHFAQSTLRGYLEAGGRLVWMGDVTFYYLQGPSGPIRCAGGLLPQLVDVSTDQRIFYGPPGHEQVLTDEGRQWGLTQPWFGMPCNSSDVTQTLVAAPTDKASLIFLKTLNPEYPLSGLLSFSIKLRGDELNLPLLADIYKAASYWGRPVRVPEVARAEPAKPDLEVLIRLGDDGSRRVYLPEQPLRGLVSVANRTAPLTGVLSIRLSDAAGTYFGADKELGLPVGEAPVQPLDVPTAGLRCGTYALQASFTPAGGTRLEQALEVVLVERPERPFFLGIWGQVPANAFRRAQYLDEIRSYHLDPVCSPGYDDDLLRRGMRFVQRIEAYEGFTNAVDAARDPDLARRAADGKAPPNPWRPALSLASIAHPQVVAGWSEGQREQIRDLSGHPAWFPAILTCDDFSAFYGEDFGPYSAALFTERTGLQPPALDPATKALPLPPKGIVPEDDLRLRWYRHTVEELGGFANRLFTAAKDQAAPRVPFGPVPGGMMVPVWTDGQYPPAAFGGGGFDLLSYYYYNAYWQPEIGNLYFDELLRLANRDLPLWTTPDLYIAGDEPSYYRNAFFLHLAGGVSGLNYYAYSEHKPQAIREIGRLAARLEELGPLQVALKPAPKRIGFFLPLTCSAMDWAYAITALYAFSNLICAQVDVEPVCREELLAGRAHRYEAIVGWNVDWLSQAEAEGLNAYMARGGRFVLDAASAVELPGASRLAVDLAMGAPSSTVNNEDPRVGSPGQQDYNKPEVVEAVRQALAEFATYTCADPTVVVRAFAGAGATYLWCVQVHTGEEYRYLVERMPVYKRTEDRPVAEEEGRSFLRQRGVYDQAVQTTLVLPDRALTEGMAVYDVWAGRRLAASRLQNGQWQVPLTMERLGGTLLALYPSAPARIGIQAFPGQVKRGGWSALDIRFYGDHGRLLTGLLPCRLRVLDPKGVGARISVAAVRDGRHLLRFAPARNDDPGEWTVEVTELAGGVSGRTAVKVE